MVSTSEPPHRQDAGHRLLSHTADVILEAWGPDRESCVAHAVLALLDSFADTRDCEPQDSRTMRTDTADDASRLVSVLEEVIYLVDAEGVVPVRAGVGSDASGEQLTCRFDVAPLNAVTLVGSTPKAVAWHGLRIGRTAQGWSCRTIVDV